MPLLDNDFIDSLAELGKPYPRLKWYATAIVALSAINYPEEIPNFYSRLLEVHIPEAEKFNETRKIKEALTKVCGIQGAAKCGTALRALYDATPEHLIDSTCYRESETDEKAYPRGDAFVKSLYKNNPDINTNEDHVRKCAPDYFYCVSRLFYPYIFSFDGILNYLESSQAIVSSLIGIDCHGQATNQMKGMMYNGGTKEEVTMIRTVVVRIAQKLNVQFKTQPVAVPNI